MGAPVIHGTNSHAKRQCGAQTRAKSFGAVQFWPFTVQINHSFLCIWFFGFCTGASFILWLLLW